MAKEKKEITTLGYYKRWKVAKYGLNATKWLSPFAPATAITIANWEEWFAKQGTTLPFGFASLLISILITILAMSKKDEFVEKKVSYMFYLAGVIAMWGVSFMLLANIMNTMGMMFMFTAMGIIGGGGAEQVNKSLVSARISEYKQLVDENGLDKKAQAKALRKEKALKERELKAQEEAKVQATE
jgi:hypothetical protein